MKLTAKQRRFVDEYLIDLNATQAAIRAGYAAKNADVTGPRMLGNVGIAAAIAEGQKSRSTRVEADAAWVLRRLTDEADADLADLYAEDGSLKPVRDWPAIWRKGLVAGIEVEELREDGVVIGHVRKVKLSDRVKRLEMLARHNGMFVERREVTGKGGGPIQHAVSAQELSDDELAAIVAGGSG